MTADDHLASLVGEWPVAEPALGVVTASGGRAVAGPTHRRIRLASVSKPLSALAVLVAVEERSIDLDEPAGPPGSTVRHLLAHASGLAFDDDGVLAAPGSRRIYSNTGIERVADHVGERSGIAFADYLREAVFEPLGMRSTTLDGSPAHSVTSTLDDVLAFAAELLEPTVIDRSTLAEATSVQFPDLAGVLPGIGRFDPNPWGLGFEIRDHKQPHWTGRRNSAATYGHFGATGTFLWVDPRAGMACAGLTGSEFGSWALEHWTRTSDAVLERFGRG